MLTRFTFVTIGQTPRVDLVPEITSSFPETVEVVERGALDGLDDDAIVRLAPDAGDRALVTRLRDGRQAIIGQRWVASRLREMLDSLPGSGQTHATVLLCTGDFSELEAPGLFLDAQHLVDHGVDALCRGARSVGLLVPLPRQEAEHHYVPPGRATLRTAHASPYEDADFEATGAALSTCDFVVMHCMGYTEAQRGAVAAGSGRPVILARRLVAAALGQLL